MLRIGPPSKPPSETASYLRTRGPFHHSQGDSSGLLHTVGACKLRAPQAPVLLPLRAILRRIAGGLDLRDHDASIPTPLDRAHPRGRPLRPSAPAAHAKLASLPFPRPARGHLRPHHLCPAGSGPVAHRGRGAGWRGWPSSTPFISCAVRWKKKAHSKNTPRIRGGRALKRRRNEVRRPLSSRFSLSRAASPLACNRPKPRLEGAGHAEKYGERAAESEEE